MYIFVILITKVINQIIATFKLGSGYTWPGNIALKIYPSLFKHPKLFPSDKSIYITGTNGKTTTSKIINHILTKNGFKIVSNTSGANLLNGILTPLLLDKTPFGDENSNVGVFEVDEFVLPKLLSYHAPDILVLLNLSRDQLDRYGETDIIFDKWLDSFRSLSSDTTIICYERQPEFEKISQVFKGTILYFNENDSVIKNTKLRGAFNAQNLNASFLVAACMGIDSEVSEDSLQDFQAAYGRGELFEKNGKIFQIYLAKNPASQNHNMDLLLEELSTTQSVLLILNDNIPDGRDVSWIYDIDPEKMKNSLSGKKIFVSGTRCNEMATRLDYAGVSVLPENVNNSLPAILQKIYDSSETSIVVFPNYSAMLELRKLLMGRSIL